MLASLRVFLYLAGADWGTGKHDAGHWTPELLSCPAVTGPILGPSVPAGAATGNLAAPYSRYDALEVNDIASSRGDEEEGFASSEKARPSVPWYKDFQVKGASSGILRISAVHASSPQNHKLHGALVEANMSPTAAQWRSLGWPVCTWDSSHLMSPHPLHVGSDEHSSRKPWHCHVGVMDVAAAIHVRLES